MRRVRASSGSAPPLDRIVNPDVAAIFRAYPPRLRTVLRRLRRLILETATATDGVGALDETLKWGQPSYLTAQSRSGSTIRIDRTKTTPSEAALYFHCLTDLVETFRVLYPDTLRFGGNRSILIDPGAPVPEAALRHCIQLALTYRARGKRAASDC